MATQQEAPKEENNEQQALLDMLDQIPYFSATAVLPDNGGTVELTGLTLMNAAALVCLCNELRQCNSV